MASYHWAIATDQDGTELFTFQMNPLDISGMFPEKTYTRIPVLAGPAMTQYPDYDTRIRTMAFDLVPEENTTHTDFLLGTSDNDSSSLRYLDRRDSDGQLTKYWLKIPEAYKQWRPRGYMSSATIPIIIYDVRAVPEGRGRKRWRGEIVFSIVPKPDASEYFEVDNSQLGGQNFLISNHLDAVYSYDLNLTAFADETTESYTESDAWPDITIATGDIIYFGCASEFYGIQFVMDTAESVSPDSEQGATPLVWEFSDSASSWDTLTVVDGTENFVKDSTVTWGAEAAWVRGILSGLVVGGPTTELLYWVRVTVGSVTTAWKIDTALRL